MSQLNVCLSNPHWTRLSLCRQYASFQRSSKATNKHKFTFQSLTPALPNRPAANGHFRSAFDCVTQNVKYWIMSFRLCRIETVIQTMTGNHQTSDAKYWRLTLNRSPMTVNGNSVTIAWRTFKIADNRWKLHDRQSQKIKPRWKRLRN